MAKIPISIRLEEEQLSTIKQLNINLSEWVRDKLKEEVLTLKEIGKRLKINEKELKMLENMKKSVLHCNTNEEKLTKSQREFLLESKSVLHLNPQFLNGRINLYMNNFGILNKPTKKQFLDLLKRVK